MKYAHSVPRKTRYTPLVMLGMIGLLVAALAPGLMTRGAVVAQAASRVMDAPSGVTVTPGSGVPNQSIAVTVTTPLTTTAMPVTVQFVQAGPSGIISTTLATFTTTGGDVAFQSAVPLAALPGAAAIVGCYGSSNCTASTFGLAGFNVATPATTLAPNPALTGQTVAISGSGFTAYETVTVTVSSTTLLTTTTTPTGGFSSVFAAPAAAGVYTVTATGLTSGYRVTNFLTVVSPTVQPTPTAQVTATGTPQATATTPQATATGTPQATATSTAEATGTPEATATPCVSGQGHGNSCAAHTCPRGAHGVHGRCVSQAAHMHIFVTVSRHALRHGAIRVVVVERTAHHAITFVKTHRGRAQGTTARGTLKARHGQTQGNHGAASSTNNSGGHGKGSGHGKGKGKH